MFIRLAEGIGKALLSSEIPNRFLSAKSNQPAHFCVMNRAASYMKLQQNLPLGETCIG